MIKMYLFLKWNRGRKKRQMYKKAAQISFDVTTIFYVLLVVGYILYAIISEGNLIKNIQNVMGFLKYIEIRTFSYVFLVLPTVYLLKGFKHPGIAFSSTEYKWSIQPVSRLRIWGLLALDKWARAALVYIIIGSIYGLLSATPVDVVVLYISLLFGLNIVMTPLEWKFFQLSFWKKLGLFIMLLAISGLSLILDIRYVLGTLGVLMIIFNIICLKSLVKQVPWERVTAAVDFKIWNMNIISQMTKIKFEKPRQYSILQRLPSVKKPFLYEKNTIYHRLWRLHVGKNWTYLFRLSGILFVFMMVTVFLKQWLFLAAVFITSQVHSELMVALFRDRFREDIVAILPWDVQAYRDTFRPWAFTISGIYMLPSIAYVLVYPSFASVLGVCLFTIFFVVQLLENLNKQKFLMDNIFTYQEWIRQLSTAGMAFVFLSLFQSLFFGLAIATALVLIAVKLKGIKH